MLDDINWKSVALSIGLVVAFSWYSNFNPVEDINFINIILYTGLVLTSVHLSRYIIKVKQSEIIPTTIVAKILLFLVLFYAGSNIIGISGPASMVELPTGAQSILGFVIEDVVGIPLWVIGLLVAAVVLFMFMNPLLGIGLALILLAAGLFIFTPLFPFDEILSAGLGLILAVKGLVGGRSPRPIPQQPIILKLDTQ